MIGAYQIVWMDNMEEGRWAHSRSGEEKGSCPINETPASFPKTASLAFHIIPWILALVLIFKMVTILQKGKPMRANDA